MATNPLIPYTDMVSGDPTPDIDSDAVGVGSSAGDPVLAPGSTPGMWELWNQEIPEAGVESEGNFNDDAELDSDQVEDDNMGVPLPLPPLPGAPYPSQDGGWRDDVAPPPHPLGPDGNDSIHEFTGSGQLTREQMAQRERALAELAPKPQEQKLDPESRRILSGGPRLKEDPSFMDFLRASWETFKSGKVQGVYEKGAAPKDYPEVPGEANYTTPFVTDENGKPLPPRNPISGSEVAGPGGSFPANVAARATGRPQIPAMNDFAGIPADPDVVTAPEPQPTPTNPRYVSDDPQMAGKIISTARTLVGRPHMWGGESAHGADDAGLVRAAYRSAGRELPGLADPDSNVGTAVKVSSLRPGDLITWRDPQDKSGGSRVGIFIGKGQFITSSINRGVSVRNVSDLDGKSPSGHRVERQDRSGYSLSDVSPSQRRTVEKFNKSLDSVLDSLSIGGDKSSSSKKKSSSKKSSGDGGGGSHTKSGSSYTRRNAGKGAVSGGKRHRRNTKGRGHKSG